MGPMLRGQAAGASPLNDLGMKPNWFHRHRLMLIVLDPAVPAQDARKSRYVCRRLYVFDLSRDPRELLDLKHAGSVDEVQFRQ